MTTKRKNLGLIVALIGMGMISHTLVFKNEEKISEDERRQRIPCSIVVRPIPEFISAEQVEKEELQYQSTWEHSAAGGRKF